MSSQKVNNYEEVIAHSKNISDNESCKIGGANTTRNKKRNEKIVGVYLQTPYKVNGYNEIKSSLYRAENNLRVHTCLNCNKPMKKTKIGRNNSNDEEQVRGMLINRIESSNCGIHRSQNSKITRNRDRSNEKINSMTSDKNFSSSKTQPLGNIDSVFNLTTSNIGKIMNNETQRNIKFLNPI